MQPELIIALLLALPITILMAAFIWYLNIGGLYTVIKAVRRKRPSAAKTNLRILSSTTNNIQPAPQEVD